MSEYQYYEFRKIGGTLSEKARREVSRLSSEAQVTRTSAIFTYEFDDFRGSPIKVLAKHFDVLLYLASWGGRRLAFRLPAEAVDQKAIAQFAYRKVIGVKQQESHLLVDVNVDDEALGDCFDAEAELDRIVGLYDDLLVGDYRALFLLWLQAAGQEEEKRPAALPPVPAGLGQLEERHRALIELFGIHPGLAPAAEPFSAPLRQFSDAELARAIDELPSSEQSAFLKRIMLAGAPSTVIAELRLRLQNERGEEFAAAPLAAPPSARFLFSQADEMQANGEIQEGERKAGRQLQRLAEVARDEASLWSRVNELIAKKTIAAYEEAVEILKDLRDLASAQQRLEEFGRKAKAIHDENFRRPNLRSMIKYAGLF